jgi:myo-inositol-1(or 4)-monophosphatase
MKHTEAINDALLIGVDYLKEHFRVPSPIYSKGPRDFALQVDIDLERIYKSALAKHFPHIPFVGEELSPNLINSGYKGWFWSVDPLDGTANYFRGIPEFGSSIALMYDGIPVAAGVAFPIFGELFLAESGCGAFLNGERICVSDTNRLDQAIVGFGDFAIGRDSAETNRLGYSLIQLVGDQVQRVRMPGTAALQLAWVAAGRFDVSITLENHSWDVQPGVLLVREAGGIVCDHDGTEHSLLSNFTLAMPLRLKDSVLDAVGSAIELSLR